MAIAVILAALDISRVLNKRIRIMNAPPLKYSDAIFCFLHDTPSHQGCIFPH